MENHFHLLVRMHPGEEFSDEEIKQTFSRFYNRLPNRKRVFWSDLRQVRSKSSNTDPDTLQTAVLLIQKPLRHTTIKRLNTPFL